MVRSGDWVGSIRSALFGNAYAEEVLNLAPSWRQAAVVAGFVLLNFPNMTLPVFVRGCAGLARGKQPASVRRYLLAALAVHALFAVRYDVVDQHTFFLPTYLLVSLVAGLGFACVAGTSMRPSRGLVVTVSALLVLTPVVYAVVPHILRRAEVLRHIAHEKPYRDDYVYLLVPWTAMDRSAERVGREAIEMAGDEGIVIVEDSMARPAVEYEQMRRNRSDVEIISKSPGGEIDAHYVADVFAQGCAVVLVPLDRNSPSISAPVGVWSRRGDLYVLSGD